MEMSCPGRQGRNVDSQIIRCPECHAPVEMFSDEQKARCKCGHVILRDAVPSCIAWCPAAERCLGSVIDVREVRKKIEAMQRESKAVDYVADVRKRIDESHEHTEEGGGRDEEPPADS